MLIPENSQAETMHLSIAAARRHKSQKLAVPSQQISELPDSIGQLTALEELILSGNALTSLPDAMGQLTSLVHLDLSNNNLQTLPESLRNLRNLRKLNLAGNPALGIPPEILKTDSPADILQFYFSASRQAKHPLGEAKILIVGQAGVGKTSLVQRMLGSDFDPHSPTTEGIAIAKCQILRCDTDCNWQIQAKRTLEKKKSEAIWINIWDFGGQEIMHATHQFFLTKRSLYLLVLDARKSENDGNLHYWLKLIQSYGGDAPIIVVINKCEPPFRLDLNQNRLLQDYSPNLVGFIGVSCKTGLGISSLRELISKHIAALPHVSDMVPLSYFAAKEKLEACADDYMDHAAYEKLCIENGVRDADDRRVLLRFLHDLGSVLNFNDPKSPYSLSDTNVLKPEWVTRGVYDVLLKSRMHMNPKDGDGVLDRSKLDAILDPHRYPVNKHDFIIGMMMAFELCFESQDQPGKLLIPEQLSKNEPDLRWRTDKGLNFEYRYNLLPEGIILRFIVKMRTYFTERPTCWRSGVVVKFDACEALVRSDTQNGRMYISVLGPVAARRAALAVVRARFREIHATIPRLEVKEKVPLPGQQEVVVDYEHLLRLEQMGQTVFLPEGARQMVRVVDLLNGIESLEERLQDQQHNITVLPLGKEMRSEGHIRNPSPDYQQFSPIRPPPSAQASVGEEAARHERKLHMGQTVASGGLGVFFLMGMLVVAIAIPQPTDFQIWVFRVVLAVTAAAFGAIVPGSMDLGLKRENLWAIRAGGAVALFAVIFLLNPPALVKNQCKRCTSPVLE